MTDSIQASSSLPLPAYQTTTGSHDPLPPSAPQALTKSLDTRSAADQSVKADDFKSYLDRTSITVVAKHQSKAELDPADMIAQGSVYASDAMRPL